MSDIDRGKVGVGSVRKHGLATSWLWGFYFAELEEFFIGDFSLKFAKSRCFLNIARFFARKVTSAAHFGNNARTLHPL